MPRNGTGVYNLPAGNPVSAGTVIDPNWANTTLTDIGTALTGSIARDGQAVPTANIPMGSFKFTGLGAGSVPGDSIAYGQASVTLNDITTTVNLNVGGVLLTSLGAVGAPSHSFTGDTNTGMWSPGADLLSFSTGGTERSRFANNGLKFLTSGNSAADVASTYSLATSDKYLWVDSTRSANNREAEILWSSGIFTGRFVNDAYGAATNWLAVTGGQAAGVSQIDFLTGAGSQTMRLSGSTVNIGPATATALYEVQVQGAGQQTVAVTDAGVKGGAIYLRDSASGGVGQGGYLAFGAFDSATPFGGIKGSIGNAAGNTTGDIVVVGRRATGDTAQTENFRFYSDGRVSGTALHNNANAVTGTTNQYIASGTYTPTLTNGSNVTASTAYACQWMRVGNVVTVSGKVDIDPNLTSTSTQLGISLPIASTTGGAQNLAGTAVGDNGSALANAAQILADTANNRANLAFWSSSTANAAWSFNFTYVIL